MTPVTTSFKSFATDRHINLPLVPQKPIVSTLPKHRILMSFWEREVKIWRVDELAESNPDVLGDDETQGRTLLSRIILSVWTASPVKSLPTAMLIPIER